jgi:hypothetical protein
MVSPFNATIAIAEPIKATNAQIIARIEYCVAQYDLDLTDHLEGDAPLKRLKKADLIEVLELIEDEAAEAIAAEAEEAAAGLIDAQLDRRADLSDELPEDYNDLWNDGEEPEGDDLEVAEAEGTYDAVADLNSIISEVAANHIPGDDETPVSSDKEPSTVKTKKVKVEDGRTVDALLVDLAASKFQSERKKIRALLRAKGYKISEHKVKAAKAEKVKAAAKGKGKKAPKLATDRTRP